MTPNKHQEAIFKEYRSTNNNIVISATAGSGKSSTIIALAEMTAPYKKVGFFAFNKSIAEELNNRTPDNVHCSTIHSLGAQSLFGNVKGRVKVKDNKSWTFITTYLKNNGKDKKPSYKNILKNLISLYRLYMCKSVEELIPIAEMRGYTFKNGEIDDLSGVLADLEDYNQKKIKSAGREFLVDFTDMLYLPVKYNLPIRQFDVVMIDEGQDLNEAQTELIRKAIKDRFVVVGDEKQAIYHFMGSTTKIFEQFKNYPKTKTMPLSVTYRCAKAITGEAQKVFGEDSIQYHEKAKDGEVRYGSVTDAENSDMIVCRNNKPLLMAWIKLVSAGKKAHIYGKDLAEQIKRIIDDIDKFEWDEAVDYFGETVDYMKGGLMAKGITHPERHPKVQSFIEKIEIIKILRDNFGDYKAMKKAIKDIYSGNLESGINLMTIHKSKGLEADRVFFLEPDLIPSEYAESDEEKYAEECLKFVAITRAKNELIYC